jgi:hypothetical protein
MTQGCTSVEVHIADELVCKCSLQEHHKIGFGSIRRLTERLLKMYMEEGDEIEWEDSSHATVRDSGPGWVLTDLRAEIVLGGNHANI